jgi:hypothetical protein
MITHKIQGDRKTACGIDIWEKEIQASRDWEDVDCKTCRTKYKTNSKVYRKREQKFKKPKNPSRGKG